MIAMVQKDWSVWPKGVHVKQTIISMAKNAVSAAVFRQLFYLFQHSTRSLFPSWTVEKLTNNEECESSDSCDDSAGLSCIEGVCSCSTSQQFDGQSCAGKGLQTTSWYLHFIYLGIYILYMFFEDKRGFNKACSPSVVCNDEIGLSCQVGICKCSTSYFFDGTECGRNETKMKKDGQKQVLMLI